MRRGLLGVFCVSVAGLVATGCDDSPPPKNPFDPPASATKAPPPVTEVPKPKGPPELSIDDLGPKVGFTRVLLDKPEGREKLARELDDTKEHFDGKEATLSVVRKAKLAHVVAMVSGLEKVGVTKIIIKTETRKELALIALGNALSRPQALKPGSKARAEQLQQQGVLGVPAGLGLAEKQRHEPGPATLYIESNQQDCATAQHGQARSVRRLVRRRHRRIGETPDPQVLQAPVEPWKFIHGDVRQHLGIADRESAACRDHAFDTPAVLAEQRNAGRVASEFVAQRFQRGGQNRVCLPGHHVLQIDCQLRIQDVEATRGTGADRILHAGDCEPMIHVCRGF